MKRNSLLIILFSAILLNGYGQDEFESTFIKQMSWGMDYKIKLTLKNDSVYIYDLENLQHTNANYNTIGTGFTYYPVGLSPVFVEKLKQRGVELGLDTTKLDTSSTPLSSDKTLWSAIHNYIGGGWIHFVNTLLYSIEKNNLNIHAAILKRPESKWKPKPMTESYKRTRGWKYYVPVTQKEAHREYKIRKEKGELGDLQYLPEKFIELFLNTSDAEYKKMIKNGDRKSVARIDLIKLLLGANYLGKNQIVFIKHMELKSVLQYSSQQLPSVIIFEGFNAAVALTLDEKGYRIEKIVYKDEDRVSADDIEIRNKTIYNLIKTINDVNMEIFRDKLEKHYK